VRALATATTAMIYAQIIIGATMRHTGAGLAIPDFPLMFGGIVPDHWDPRIAIHFAHRVGAVVVAAAIFATLAAVLVRARQQRQLVVPALVLDTLVVVQIVLGAMTVLSGRNPWINSFHVVCGALVLTTSLVLTLRGWRSVIADSELRIADSRKAIADRDPIRNPINNPIRNPQSAIRNSSVARP
jgi:heme a synthase